MDPEQRVWREESCYEQMSREMREELMRVRAENARLRELLSDVWTDSTIEHDDKRLDYVVVQMTRSVYEDVRSEYRRKSQHRD